MIIVVYSQISTLTFTDSGVIYWCKVKRDDGEDGFEVLDGQQRTISLCEYVEGSFSVDDKYFYNLPSDQKKKILDYPLFV